MYRRFLLPDSFDGVAVRFDSGPVILVREHPLPSRNAPVRIPRVRISDRKLRCLLSRIGLCGLPRLVVGTRQGVRF